VLSGIACPLRSLAARTRLPNGSSKLRAERSHLGFVPGEVEAVVGDSAVADVDRGAGSVGNVEESAVHAELLSAQTLTRLV
jgi:hypothetical protein